MNLRKLLVSMIIVANLSGSLLFAAELYKDNAVVSYYGEKFHGKKTSNGEIYNMHDLTCASKTLPFDTVLKVTNLANGKSVQVRVNDRGPFVAGRELDLSKAAAIKLDMIKSGTARVRIEIIKRGPDTKLSQQTAQKSIEMMKKKEAARNPKPKSKSGTDPSVSEKKSSTAPMPGVTYEIQVGAYKDKGNANHIGNELMDLGIKNVVLRKSGEIYRVVIKDLSSKDLEKVEKLLRNKGFNGYVVKEKKL